MNAKQLKIQVDKEKKAKQEARDAMFQADRAVHSENSTLKYDHESGSMR